MKTEIFKIYEDCRFVKGYNRSIIYDLGKNDFFYIPNKLYEIVERFNNKKLSEIFKYYGKKNEPFVHEYLTFLFDNKFAFSCNEKQANIFVPLNTQFETPSIITNAIIEISKNINFLDIFNQLENLGCYNIQLISYKSLTYSKIKNIVKLLKNSSIKYVEIITKYSSNYSEFQKIIDDFSRINSIILHSAPENYVYNKDKYGLWSIISKKKKVIFLEDLSVIKLNNFFVNLPLFMESLNVNNFYYKKVIINRKGNLLNNIYNSDGVANVNDKNILEIISNNRYKKYWTISKDKIEVCKDCEYRYMCIDSRVPEKDAKNNYFFTNECGYNPYISKWKNEEGYKKIILK